GVFLFSFLCVLGSSIFALGSHFKASPYLLPLMLTGRLLFGSGNGSLTIVRNRITAFWFRGKELALAFGLTLAFSRLGSVLNFLFTQHFEAQYGMQWTLWGAAHKQFAEDDLSKSINYCNHFLWPAKTKINMFGSEDVQHVWRRPGEENQENCVLPTVNRGGGNITVWGCISADGSVELQFIEGNMESNMYILKQNTRRIPAATFAALTRLADSGTIREANYTFFWQGKPLDESRQHGVGFAVKNTLNGRHVELASVLLTRSYHSADCDTDYSLVASKALTKETPDDTIDFKWSHLRNAVYNSITAYRKKESKNTDWYEAKWKEMEPVTEAKRKALLAYKAAPSPGTLQALRTARKNAQQTARHCANTYWLNLCTSIQLAAETGDARGMFEVQDWRSQGKQLQLWVEHYLELDATQNVVTDTALDAIPDLPVMEELDTPPTLEELRKAIDCLACGKASGSDGIPPEVLKIGKPALLQPLHELLCLCLFWGQGHIPQDMRDANIVTLYKNKGDRSDCNNYRGISLLSIVGKASARAALARLQTLASRVYPESQCGFRARTAAGEVS
ncbi:major facilitator superfamily domain-containing protein 1, partial [Silurus meridionalis]